MLAALLASITVEILSGFPVRCSVNTVVNQVAKSCPEVTTGRARRKPAPRPARAATKSSSKSGEKSEEGKNRDEARRKMMEERRKAMKEAMKAKKAEAENAGGGDAVEIFVPEAK